MDAYRGLIEATITACEEQAQESALCGRQEFAQDNAVYKGFQQGTADAFRRVARELRAGLETLEPTEEHEHDRTPADEDLPFEAVAA